MAEAAATSVAAVAVTLEVAVVVSVVIWAAASAEAATLEVAAEAAEAAASRSSRHRDRRNGERQHCRSLFYGSIRKWMRFPLTPDAGHGTLLWYEIWTLQEVQYIWQSLLLHRPGYWPMSLAENAASGGKRASHLKKERNRHWLHSCR